MRDQGWETTSLEQWENIVPTDFKSLVHVFCIFSCVRPGFIYNQQYSTIVNSIHTDFPVFTDVPSLCYKMGVILSLLFYKVEDLAVIMVDIFLEATQ